MQVLYAIMAVLAIAASCNGLEENENEKLLNIEKSLANLTSQFCMSSGLFQVSLIRELLNEYKKAGHESNKKGIATLQRMETMLNTSIGAITERLNIIETDFKQDIDHLTRMVYSVQKNTQILLKHSNITNSKLNKLDDKADDTDYTPSTLLHSCEEVLQTSPNSTSGYYRLVDPTGHVRHVYCDMSNLCNKGGGWTRVSILNMEDSNEKCPIGLRLYDQNGGRACGRPVSSGGSCPGIKFPVHFKYSQVCGKVIGYQKGHPDATYLQGIMDGIRLTHGTSRSHIWSFLASSADTHASCPCAPSGKAPLSFVGLDYYCEAGRPNNGYDLNRLYTDDPLWDGKDCRSAEAHCCETHSLIPWFHKNIGYTTTDYIEMRFCFNGGTYDEDSPVAQYEIYVK
uniref:Fibrinogen C-terminal domain-containing protein n=1 Tax=Amphimedon queenslandica TaxID=400682 RepID=A0A1X7V7R8_AMPQE